MSQLDNAILQCVVTIWHNFTISYSTLQVELDVDHLASLKVPAAQGIAEERRGPHARELQENRITTIYIAK